MKIVVEHNTNTVANAQLTTDMDISSAQGEITGLVTICDPRSIARRQTKQSTLPFSIVLWVYSNGVLALLAPENVVVKYKQRLHYTGG